MTVPSPVASSPSFYTPLGSPMATPGNARKSPYRPVLPITDEIRTHCHIYFDEELYISALTLLADLVTAGASHPDSLERPTFAPLPFHIELVAALLIHPRHTNQAPPSEQLELASRSITFLRNTLAILGPVNANLTEAFSLSPITHGRSSRRTRSAADVEDEYSTSGSEDHPEHTRGIIANNGRIRRCAKDFWHMVGWAFNCSVRYPKRWKYWKIWLDYMLDVLDADWVERERLDVDVPDVKDGTEDFKMRQRSLMVKYLSDASGRSSAVKRVVRSAFADGGLESLREFPEVFPNETKEVKIKSGQKRKRQDTTERRFGDYDDEDVDSVFDSSDLMDQTPESSQDDEGDDLESWLGGTETIFLRQRLLTLISRTAADLPECFTDCIDLYDIIYANAKPLPLPAFSLLFTSSPASQFPSYVYISLTQLILSRILSLSAQRQLSSRTNDDLTQDILEKCYLPFSANTSSAADNAKVSILVENLFRLLLKHTKTNNGVFLHTPDLHAAIEKGIKAREGKVIGDKRKNSRSREDKSDLAWLNASSERLRRLLDWVEEDYKINSE